MFITAWTQALIFLCFSKYIWHPKTIRIKSVHINYMCFMLCTNINVMSRSEYITQQRKKYAKVNVTLNVFEK
jgi:hypothetical protein